MSPEHIAIVAALVAIAALIGLGCYFDHLEAKRTAAKTDDPDDWQDYLSALHRSQALDNLPPRNPAKHLPSRMPPPTTARAINPGPGLHPHPLRSTRSSGDDTSPWVIPPASMAYAPDMLGIGDTTGTDSDTRTAAVITTLCTPADVASTPGASGD